MSEILKTLVGRSVTVYSVGESSQRDTGVLQAVDDTVVVLNSASGTLIFPLYRVRLIKVED